ncbi:MAG: rRNA pseudouridine synthase [Rhizobiaceae bacterium]|nr:rRNA pseudouridine synthase [Rhizobiaceae bacterium]
MDDNRKKPNRGKPPRGIGSNRPAKGGDGGKLFRKSDGPRPFRKKEESATRFDRQERPRFKKDGSVGDKPFRNPDGERPRFRKDGDRPERRERPRFRKDGDEGVKLFRKADGERPRFRKDGDRPERQDRPGGFAKHKSPRPDRDGPRRFEQKSTFKDAPLREESWSEGERIAKRLARAGISSRRDAESLIEAGRVRVNGKLVETPALNVFASDRIELDGKEIPAIERTRLFLFHKPAGVVTTNRDPEGRKTVFEALPENLPRLMTVGRLDINTEGLLLLTNDGGLARVLELPATGWLRRYRVRVHGDVDEARLAGLKEGIAVEGVFYGAVEASLERTQGSNAWLSIGLREGKNREVKNILGALGLEVTRLIRVSYGPFQLGELPEGHVLEIKGRMLREQLGERLIEESGSNFEAEIAKPFPNKPVRRGSVDDRPREPVRRSRELNIGEGGLVKGGFRRDREREREGALDRLSTRPERPERRDGKPRFEGKPFGGKPARGGFGGKREREEQSFEPSSPRKANVWMAPGARPQAKRPSERAAERREREEGQEAGPRKPYRQEGKRFEKRDGAPRGDRPAGPRSGKPSGKPYGRPPRKG